ncbi:NADH-quinone oxidoreductase subunit C [Sulfurospirillum sp. 1612]|uniref:NADH-quinone oxidoreductase subunit C n=1 Tax=Sulfurospirillum sp. 1612 TaxID=3094835 RepID=UPI002F94B41F
MIKEIALEELKQEIQDFYDPKIWHFVCLNADDIKGRCKLQWIFSKYLSDSEYQIFTTTISYDTIVPSIMDIIPSAIMSEREVVDLFGIDIQGIDKGLYLDESSQKYPLRGDDNA